MKTVNLAAYTRELHGKGAARRYRREGKVPAVLYGAGIDPVSIMVPALDFVKAARTAETMYMIVDLQFDGNGETKMALVRDVQTDPISGKLVHLDFLHVSSDRKLKMTVPVQLNGIPEGVKTHGGILQHIMRELEIEALPADIPDSIQLNVEELGIGDTIHVRELEQENIVILSDPRRTIVSVVPPTVIKEPTTAADAEAEAAGEAELVGEDGEAKPAEGEGGEEKKEEGKDDKKDDKKE